MMNRLASLVAFVSFLTIFMLPVDAEARSGPAVVAALDDLELAAGELRTGLFTGSSAGLAQAGNRREAALDTLNEAAGRVILEIPWFDRVRWLERALEEQRPPWSLALLNALVTDSGFTYPDPASPWRHRAALALGLNARQVLRGLPELGQVQRDWWEKLAIDAYRVAAGGDDYVLRDEAFYRLWSVASVGGDTLEALQWADSLVVLHTRSLRTPQVRLTRARHRLDRGRFAEALEETRLALPHGESAELHRVSALAYEGLDQPRAAAREWETLIGRYGSTSEGWTAYHNRLRLAEEGASLHLDSQKRLELLSQLLGGPHAGAVEDSLHAIAAANPALQVQVQLKLSRRFYKTKAYGKAEPLLLAVINEGPRVQATAARYIYARILRNTGRILPMIREYRALIDEGSDTARDAVWELAREMESETRWLDAESTYTELLDRYPDHGRYREAQFRRGFARYRSGKFMEAEKDFREVFRSTRNSQEEQAAYWLARTLENLNRPEEAEAIATAAMSRTLPHGYYGVALRERYRPGQQPTTIATLPPLRPEEPLTQLSGSSTWPAVIKSHFERGLLLSRIGQLEAARREWVRAAAVGKSYPDLIQALALAAATYGVYPEGITWARSAALKFAADDPRHSSYDRLSYPAAFYDAVSREARLNGVDPQLIWSIMRQESLYDPRAVSRAGARGLLQIMPATLARIVRERGYPPMTADALFRPDLNIDLGTGFFVDRLQEFEGRLLPALASYNAGERKSWQWLERSGGDAEEVFLECVGYPETYGYLRRIVWIAWMYKAYYPPETSVGDGADEPR